jgi:lysophospholipase L1-like esterase
MIARTAPGTRRAARAPCLAPPLLLLLLLLFLVAAAAVAAAAAAGPPPSSSSSDRPVVLFFGDSLTEFGSRPGGWVLDLTSWYGRRADVVSRGFGGYNSRFLAYVLDQGLDDFSSSLSGGEQQRQRVAAAVVAVGSNDAKVPGAFGPEVGVPLSEYRRNLRALVRRLRARGVAHVVVATPPPADERRRAEIARELAASGQGPSRGLSDRLSERTAAYAEAAREVARAECAEGRRVDGGGGGGGGASCPVVVADLFAAFERLGAAARAGGGGGGGEDEGGGGGGGAPIPPEAAALFVADGLHLSPQGNAVMAAEIKRALRATPLSAEALAPQFPAYYDVDPRRPGEAFAAAFPGGVLPASARALVEEVTAGAAAAAAAEDDEEEEEEEEEQRRRRQRAPACEGGAAPAARCATLVA